VKDLFNGFQSFLGVSRSLEADRRQLEAEEYARRARQRARLIEHYYLERAASGELGDARLGKSEDARRAGLHDPAGWFIGALNGQMIFNNADGHHLIYARAGAGKGTTSAQPNLAHFPGSMFVIDVKDGELHYSSARHRAEALGHEIITLDPWGIRGGQTVKVCPLHRLRKIGLAGLQIDNEADEIALMLLPRGQAEAGDNAWVRKGARRLMTVRMKHLAYAAPKQLSLTALWRFVNCSDEELEVAFTEMSISTHEDVAGEASAMRSVFSEAPKQFEAYRADSIDALSVYRPGGALADATSANEFDFSEMKHRDVTVFLCTPSSKLGVAASWLGLLANQAIEDIAATVGPSKVHFLIDEFAQLPVIPAITKCLRLYRGRGLLLHLYCQGRFSLRDAGYSEAIVKEIEDQAACHQMWGVEDPSLLRDVEYWSGNTSIVQVNPSHSGGQIAQAGFGRSERARKVLQVEDIRLINEGKQIVKLPGYPLFVADRIPYWGVSPWKHQLRDVRELHFGQSG
jgi:type IV secretion system protein VirD4